MSDNDLGWSVFWCQGASRKDPPSASTLRSGKTVYEDTDTTRADETIGLIVFEAGHGSIGGVAYEAALGADSIRGVGSSPPYASTFNTSFNSSPTVAVTTMAGMDGGNGGWSYTYGTTMATQPPCISPLTRTRSMTVSEVTPPSRWATSFLSLTWFIRNRDLTTSEIKPAGCKGILPVYLIRLNLGCVSL